MSSGFENTGKKALVLDPANYEPEPKGGWRNWKLKDNLEWVNETISRNQQFTLVGDIEKLKEQAKNAGNGETICAIGAIVLVLYRTGYTVFKPDEDKPFHVLKFLIDDDYSIPYDLEIEAIDRLYEKKAAGKFWNMEERKQEYNYILDVITE